jgi:hypothetical protein
VANTIPVSAEKLIPLLPDEYSLVPAAALGLGSWDQGIVAIANFRGDNPQVDHRKSGQAQQVAIDVLILVNEPAEAATLGVNIPGAFHLYTLAIYTNDPQYAASLRAADMPVQFVPGITYDRLMDDATGVGDVNVAVPAKGSPFYSFNTGFGYGPAGALDTVFWHDGKHGKAVLHFHDEPFQQGQAQSQIYTQPGSKWDNLLSGGGLGPGTTDPVTGYHSIVTPSLNFRYGQGTSGRLMLIAPPARVESVVGNDGSAQRLSNGNYVFTSGFQGTAPKFFGQSIGVRPDGSKASVLEVNKREYRSFRMRSLYEGISDQLAGNGGETSHHGDDSRGRSRGDGHGVPDRPENVQRLDQLFAAGLEDGASFVLPRSGRNPLRFGEEDGADATPSGWE